MSLDVDRDGLWARERTPPPSRLVPRFVRPEVLGYHLTMRPADGRGLAREAAGLRCVARVLYRLGASRGLLAFRAADTHLHVLVALPRREAGQFARHVQSALKQALRLPVTFEPARYRPIVHERHLANALRYVFRQEEHHGTAFDLAHDGSSLPDLLGMRHLGGEPVLARLRELLPRLTRDDLRRAADLDELSRRDGDPDLLAEAAAAAVGLADLAGRSTRQVLARLAAVHAVGLASRQVARLLDVTPRAVQTLRRREVPRAFVNAVELQLRWRTALARRPAGW